MKKQKQPLTAEQGSKDVIKGYKQNKKQSGTRPGRVDLLVKALEAGQSEVLFSYLTAMAQFHHYSFQNIFLIARLPDMEPAESLAVLVHELAHEMLH